ncbi:MAG: hypothetical protein ACQEVT_01085 [Pseudomonadota bacterium]
MNHSEHKTVGDCQAEAVVLSEMLRGIELMNDGGKQFDGARVAVTIAAAERAEQLAAALDAIQD